MDAAEPARHVGIKPCDERNSRGAAEPGRADARDRQAQQECEWRYDPQDTDATCHARHRLDDALQNADVRLADSDEQRERRANIKQARKNSSPNDGARQSLRRVLNFIAHDGSEFETNQAETDDAEGIENK